MKVESPDNNQVTHFVDIVSEKVDSQKLIEEIRKSPSIVQSDVASVGSNRIVGAVTSKECKVCAVIMDSKAGYFVGPAVSDRNSQMSYKLFMGGDAIPKFLQTLHNKGIDYKISDISKISTRRALTPKQEKVLKSALDLGYYDYPKRISTEQLAETVGLAASTVTEILRRAERRIISGYFETN